MKRWLCTQNERKIGGGVGSGLGKASKNRISPTGQLFRNQKLQKPPRWYISIPVWPNHTRHLFGARFTRVYVYAYTHGVCPRVRRMDVHFPVNFRAHRSVAKHAHITLPLIALQSCNMCKFCGLFLPQKILFQRFLECNLKNK